MAGATPTDNELLQLYEDISFKKSGVRPAILSVIPDYLESYKTPDLIPQPLASLYTASKTEMNYKELLEYSQRVSESVIVTPDQVKYVEEHTRRQRNDRLWMQIRTGRVTASVVHEVLHTNAAQPSISLITKICNPQGKQVATRAMQNGIQHEKDGLKALVNDMEKTHDNFEVSECGIFMKTSHPFLAATPDGISSCLCCGKGCIEVKCPDSKNIKFYSEKNHSCFDSEMNVKRDHKYFSQMQLQMFMTDTEFCDLVVWTEEESVIRRIKRDNFYIHELIVAAENFFKVAVLPELVGRFFSRGPGGNPTNKLQQLLYCYCEKEEEEGRDMVGCDNEACTRRWFHFACVGIKHPPKSKTWFCPDCRLLDKCRPKKTT